MQYTATIANSLWLASNAPAFARFGRALERPEETQLQLLRNTIARNAGCAYGRLHGFSGIRTYEEFALRVPLVNYDDVEPWIRRIVKGEGNVLAAETVTRLVPTSGSSGARKLIPFTAGLQREFDAAIAPWVCDLYRGHPSMLGGPAYWSITPALQTDRTESAVPVGFDDDSGYLGGVKKHLVNKVMAVQPEVRLVTDMKVFRYVTLLCLLRARDLRLISVWHPSFLTLLLDALQFEFEDLVSDISTGCCKYENALPAEVVRTLKLRPLSRRAAELETADITNAVTLWPLLKTVSCWGDGSAELALSGMRQRLPGVYVQAKGLLATEGVITIPFRGTHPAAVCSHFFEFIDAADRVCRLHELCLDETYEVVVTTAGGLWRYRMGDFVRVTGFAGQTPTLRFLGRNNGVSSLFGEKLSEIFVSDVVQKALEITRIKPCFAMLAPDEGGDGCAYTLYLEGPLHENLAETLDRMLRENPHYAWCRDLGQLQPARIFSISENGYEVFVKRSTEKGARAGEIKPALLSVRKDWSKYFRGNYHGQFTAA
jgi:hypothetical protein